MVMTKFLGPVTPGGKLYRKSRRYRPRNRRERRYVAAALAPDAYVFKLSTWPVLVCSEPGYVGRVELLAETGGPEYPPDKSRWVYRSTGMAVYIYSPFDTFAARAAALLNVALIEQRRVDALLADDEPQEPARAPPRLRALTANEDGIGTWRTDWPPVARARRGNP